MAIHVILGKPGSGKSLYAVMLLIRQLLETSRYIVTNLPLKMERLNEYIQERWPDANCRAVERVRLLTDEEMGRFWEFRGHGPAHVVSGNTGYGTADEGNGVAYFLDEAHIAFNARDWAKMGRQALHYLSQHRKLGDVVFPITQSAGNLDKQFRTVAEDFTVLRNEYIAKLGPFRGAGRFKRRSYYQEPMGNAEPYETATFKLDVKGVASCYDTAQGIGVHGSKADIGRRAKGISIYWAIPMWIGAACSIVIIPWLGSRFVVSKSQEATQRATMTMEEFKRQEAQPAPNVPAAVSAAGNDVVWVSSVLVVDGKPSVILSDGRRFNSRHKELEVVEKFRVRIAGVWYPIP